MTRLRALVLASVAVFAAAITAAGTAQAGATAECIPASHYVTLARLTEGDMPKLASLLGASGRLPPDEGCRAVLLSGALTKGSAASLLSAIEVNKGWLTQVYLSVSDGDLAEEIEIAHLMRDFALTGLLLETDDDYAPDIINAPAPLPASVSDSWPETETELRMPLGVALKDYLDNTNRRVARGAKPCGAACWTILAGAIERHVRRSSEAERALSPEPPSAEQTADIARVRDGLRAEFGPRLSLGKSRIGYRPSQGIARFSTFDRTAMEASCRPEFDFVDALQGEIAHQVDGFAARNFPYMRLRPMLPMVQRLQNAESNAELCMRRGLNRMRAKAFETRCPAGKCDQGALLDKLAETARTTMAHYKLAPDVDTTRVNEPVEIERDPPVSKADILRHNAETLLRSTRQAVIGNRSGSITFVEFFDFNCGPCRKTAQEEFALLGRDPRVKIVLKELTILGPGSREVAEVAIAVRLQDKDGQKYEAFFRDLFALPAPRNKAKALDLAARQGFDMARLARDLSDPEIAATIEENATLAKIIGVGGTPSFVYGDDVLMGFSGLRAIETRIAAHQP